MDIHELTEKLGFCSEAKFLIFQADSSYDHDALKPCWQKLYDGRQNEGIADLRTALAPDENGMKRLACMLHCSLYTYELYMKKKIPKDIFFATMDFLPRFVNASQTVNGRCTFTWDWWFYRQLSLQEFRLGAFEYEMIEANGEKTLSLHIPSKADLSQRSFSDSVSSARMFFTRFFPDYANAEIMCDSWLLSPALSELLPASSRILRFASNFQIERWDKESTAALDWIFPKRDIPLAELSESTSLQRAAKAYLVNGGSIGWALEKLKTRD